MTEPRFRLIETTADVGMLVWGACDKVLFENAACGLFSVIARPRGVRPLIEKTVQARGFDVAGLLVAWLSEWLYLFDSEGFLGAKFRVDDMGAGRVKGTGWGEVHDAGRHTLQTEVKGITYHGLEIRTVPKGLRARLLLDV